MPPRMRDRADGRATRRVAARLGVAVLLALVAVPAALAAGDDGDPYRGFQWALDTIGAPEAHARGTAGGMTIAIVDSGIDLDHEDLAGKIDDRMTCIQTGGDAANCKPGGDDDHGHGTLVAGIAAAATGNDRGIAGVAPDARLMAVRVLKDDGDGGASGSASDVRAGIRWAVENGADVINLSLGEDVIISGLLGSSLTGAVKDAWDAGIVTVVSAGNTGNDQSLFGGGYDDVPAIVVTATNRSDEQASYASDVDDAQWGMAAPGGEAGDEEVGIASTWLDDTYHSAAGTSMAAPHVAGAAATLRSLGLSPDDTVNRLLDTAVDIGPPGDDSQTGAGRLDLATATEGLGGSSTSSEVTTTTSPRRTTTTTAAEPEPGRPAPTPPPTDPGAASGDVDEPIDDAGVGGADDSRGRAGDPAPRPPGDDPPAPPADETASRSDSGAGGPDPVLWFALGILGVVALPLAVRRLRAGSNAAPVEETHPW